MTGEEIRFFSNLVRKEGPNGSQLPYRAQHGMARISPPRAEKGKSTSVL
jgi:hypothetical protein